MTQSTTPAISVVMAVHNRDLYLREALASIRWQSFTNWECICVDDGSTDSTPEILAEFAALDPRFRIFRQEQSGIVAALNLGDGAARADIIARMDSDDVALPNRLALQWQFLQENQDCVGVGANVQLIDPTGSPIETSRYAPDHQEIERRLLNSLGFTVAHPTLMMRREAANAAGNYRNDFPWTHDADLLLRLSLQGKLANLDDVLLLYRQHPKNFCTNYKEEIRDELRKLLSEQHALRGLVMPAELDTSLAKPKKQSSMVGKWARRAARNGYYQTAWNLWREQLRRDPVSFETARITAETLLRTGISLLSGKRGKLIETPDWRDWDCRGKETKKKSAAAA